MMKSHQESVQKKEFLCEMCDKSKKFESPYIFSKHLLLHIGAMPYYCLKCPFTSISETHLFNHLIKHITFDNNDAEKRKRLKSEVSKKLHNCIMCDFSSKKYYTLVIHYLHHIKQNSYKCNFCKLLFFEQMDCLIHSHLHSFEMCKFCGEYFGYSNSACEKHVITHNPIKYFRKFPRCPVSKETLPCYRSFFKICCDIYSEHSDVNGASNSDYISSADQIEIESTQPNGMSWMDSVELCETVMESDADDTDVMILESDHDISIVDGGYQENTVITCVENVEQKQYASISLNNSAAAVKHLECSEQLNTNVIPMASHQQDIIYPNIHHGSQQLDLFSQLPLSMNATEKNHRSNSHCTSQLLNDIMKGSKSLNSSKNASQTDKYQPPEKKSFPSKLPIPMKDSAYYESQKMNFCVESSIPACSIENSHVWNSYKRNSKGKNKLHHLDSGSCNMNFSSEIGSKYSNEYNFTKGKFPKIQRKHLKKLLCSDKKLKSVSTSVLSQHSGSNKSIYLPMQKSREANNILETLLNGHNSNSTVARMLQHTVASLPPNDLVDKYKNVPNTKKKSKSARKPSRKKKSPDTVIEEFFENEHNDKTNAYCRTVARMLKHTVASRNDLIDKYKSIPNIKKKFKSAHNPSRKKKSADTVIHKFFENDHNDKTNAYCQTPMYDAHMNKKSISNSHVISNELFKRICTVRNMQNNLAQHVVATKPSQIRDEMSLDNTKTTKDDDGFCNKKLSICFKKIPDNILTPSRDATVCKNFTDKKCGHLHKELVVVLEKLPTFVHDFHTFKKYKKMRKSKFRNINAHKNEVKPSDGETVPQACRPSQGHLFINTPTAEEEIIPINPTAKENGLQIIQINPTVEENYLQIIPISRASSVNSDICSNIENGYCRKIQEIVHNNQIPTNNMAICYNNTSNSASFEVPFYAFEKEQSPVPISSDIFDSEMDEHLSNSPKKRTKDEIEVLRLRISCIKSELEILRKTRRHPVLKELRIGLFRLPDYIYEKHIKNKPIMLSGILPLIYNVQSLSSLCK